MTQNSSDKQPGPEDSVIVLEDEQHSGNVQGRDINAKLDMLDGSLAKLNSELDSIRDSVDEGLEKLGDSDLDLTSKVSDTYRRLGELDNTYRSLAGISADIHEEIGRLTSDISRVASQSSAELEKLEATTEVHNSYLVQQSNELGKRIDQLVSEANDTSTRLQLSIKDVQHSVLSSEQKLLLDIDQLADDTQQRDELLAKEVDKANTDIEQHAARIIKLNKVDEALDRRARDLEHTTTNLGDDLGSLDQAVLALKSNAEEMAQGMLQLAEKTEQLQRESTKHATMIGSLQARFNTMTGNLIQLGDRETLHMRSMIGLLLLLAAVLAGITLVQDESQQMLSERVAERATSVDDDLVAVATRMHQSNESMDRQLTVINSDLNEKIIRLEDKVVEVDRKLAHLDDQASSLSGRMSVDSPMSDFGGDSIVHGEQWLREQNADSWMIQIATVKQNQQMYELVDSYSSYLDQPVAYYVNRQGNHVMVYGNFDSEAAAAAAIRRLPYRIGSEYPSVQSVARIQQLI